MWPSARPRIDRSGSVNQEAPPPRSLHLALMILLLVPDCKLADQHGTPPFVWSRGSPVKRLPSRKASFQVGNLILNMVKRRLSRASRISSFGTSRELTSEVIARRPSMQRYNKPNVSARCGDSDTEHLPDQVFSKMVMFLTVALIFSACFPGWRVDGFAWSSVKPTKAL